MLESIKIIEELKASMYNKDMLLSLCGESVSEYKRGLIQGEFNTLNKVIRALENAKKK